ncbi:hypothetical protein [Halorussus rarus]|uniref:hypothetical protein n=1 Tax=Halorussus TaxID=1070314 RepID=UPI0019654557|nr:hypothetical protein [Halorussus rarus]
MDRDAILVGAGADAALAALAAAVELPEGVRWPAFAGVLAGGFVGGYLAGRLAAGPWRRRVGHGLLAGLLGGAALAVAVRWSFEPGAPSGALWPANYVLATGARWLPPGVAGRYDALIGAAAALAYGVLYAAEGALAAGAAPGGDASTAAVRE